MLCFENSRCEKCQFPLGLGATKRQLLPLMAAPDGRSFRLYGEPESGAYTYCANHEQGVGNWLVPSDSPIPFCPACALNRTIPDLSHPGYLGRWRSLEAAKHRLVHSLLHPHLPVVSKSVYPREGLQFDCKADEGSKDSQRVLTDHDNGLITINIAEVDDIARE